MSNGNVKLPKKVDDGDEEEEDSNQYYLIGNGKIKAKQLPSTISSKLNNYEEYPNQDDFNDLQIDDPNDSELNTNYNKRLNINLNTMNYLESRTDLINAIRIGFIIYPSKELIKKLYEKQPDSTKFTTTKESLFDDYNTHMKHKQKQYLYDFLLIKYLNVSLRHIIEVGDLYLCENIRILNLSNNYLFDIEPLRNCVNLYRLDVSTNQISEIPDKSFWASLYNLKFLYMHNNLISKMDYLRELSSCSNLEVLTVYDTPISLKKNYRHHFINSIFTLKAFDDYVVSDEEIIEEAHFNNRYSAKTAPFRINLIIAPSKNDSFAEELKASHELLAKINRVLAHYSPVIVIQKFVRGFLMRRRFKILKNLKLKIAVTKLQQWWRKLKKLTYKPSIEVKKSSDQQENLKKLVKDAIKKQKQSNNNNKKKNLVIDLNSLQANQLKSMSNVTIGNNNSSINLKSESQSRIANKNRDNEENNLSSARTFENDETAYLLSLYKEHSIDKVKLMKINEIIGLMSRKCSHLEDEQRRQEQAKQMFENEKKLLELSAKNLNNNRHAKTDTDSKQPDIKGETAVATNTRNDDGNEDEDDNLPVSYRLNASKCPLKLKEEFAIDTFKEKFLLTKSIRQMEYEVHKHMKVAKEPNDIKKSTDRGLTNDQRFFQKVFGNMNLGSLRAVDKAYEERDQGDKLLKHRKKIDDVKQFNKIWHQQIYDFREDVIKEAKTVEISDRIRLSKVKARKDQEELNEKQRIHDIRERNKNVSMNRKRDIKLAVEFSKQHLSVSKALQSHERHLQMDKSLKEKQEVVLKQKAEDEIQKQMVRRYLEQRNVIRVMQSNNEKELIKYRIDDEHIINDRMAKERVELIKSSKERSRISLLNDKT